METIALVLVVLKLALCVLPPGLPTVAVSHESEDRFSVSDGSVPK